MSQKTRIGYQGVEYSHNYFASLKFAEKAGLSDYELVPLITPKNVVNALNTGRITFGVMALQNNLAGVVHSSLKAITNEPLEMVDTRVEQINQSVFKKRKDIKNDAIRKVISHEMALKQCANNIRALFPNAEI